MPLSSSPTSPDDFTPEVLTILLLEQGLLPRGWVDQVRVEPEAGEFGKERRLYHLALHYTGADEPLPERIFLKFGKSRKEHFFYTTIAPEIGAPPLLRYYLAGYDPASDQTFLLLEDLSGSHTHTEWPLPPALDDCTRAVELLARIHAQWWQHPGLESAFRPALPPGRSWQARRASAVAKLPAFLDFMGDRLSPGRVRILERAAAAHPELEMPPGADGQTLLHGDFHFWNVFFPRRPGDSLRLFDWNMWDIGSPTDDLAYALAVHWYPERRARMEMALLQAYYDKLVEYGITGYSWPALQQDYRLSIIRSLLIPVWQWARGILPGVWWSHLERVCLAYEDWRCEELLEYS